MNPALPLVLRTALAVSALFAGAPSQVQAQAPVLFTNRASWQSSTTALTEIGFEGIAPHAGFSFYDSPVGLTLAGVNFVGSAPFNLVLPFYLRVVDDAYGPAFYDWGSGAVLHGPPIPIGPAGEGGPSSRIHVTLPPGTSSIGTDMGSFLQHSSPFVVIVSTVDGEFTFHVGSLPHPQRAFVGFVSDNSILSVSFYATQGFPVLDNFAFGVRSSCSLPVQPLLQGTAPKGDNNPHWESHVYDGLTGETIYTQGCALTSLTMALNTEGMSYDPGTLNEFLKHNNGYTSQGFVKWSSATQNAGRSLNLKFFPTSERIKSNPELARQYLTDTICILRKPVIVGVMLDKNKTPGHFVIVTGKQDADFTIIDPFFSRSKLSEWSNGFSLRGYVADPVDLSALNIYVDGVAELLVTDPLGRRVGFDYKAGIEVEEINGSAYFRDALANEETADTGGREVGIVQIPQPATRQFTIEVTAQAAGIYTLSVDSFASDGSSSLQHSEPTIVPDDRVVAYKVVVSTSSATASVLEKLVTIDSLQNDIRTAAVLGEITSDGIVAALEQKLTAAKRTQGPSSINILQAARNEVIAQSGKHISAAVAGLIRKDIDVLIERVR